MEIHVFVQDIQRLEDTAFQAHFPFICFIGAVTEGGEFLCELDTRGLQGPAPVRAHDSQSRAHSYSSSTMHEICNTMMSIMTLT